MDNCKKCANCEYWANKYTTLCTNKNSKNYIEFTSNEDYCDGWKKKENDSNDKYRAT